MCAICKSSTNFEHLRGNRISGRKMVQQDRNVSEFLLINHIFIWPFSLCDSTGSIKWDSWGYRGSSRRERRQRGVEWSTTRAGVVNIMPSNMRISQRWFYGNSILLGIHNNSFIFQHYQMPIEIPNCCSGYKREGSDCKAICSNGCENGYCSEPEFCECQEGYVVESPFR